MSRFAFARPIKHKNGQEVVQALEDIFTESKRHPKFYLQTDEGKEFFNKHVKELASKYGFSQFTLTTGISKLLWWRGLTAP